MARAILIYLALFGALGAWAPWTQAEGGPAPAWASTLRLDHPFSSPWFLAGVAALFASTFACTWGRRARIAGLRRGVLPPGAMTLAGDEAPLRRFLAGQGFTGDGAVLRRFGVALWAGWVLHVGLLVLIAGVFAQQALYDQGTFLLTEGELKQLSAPDAVVMRERGQFGPADPPGLAVALEAFDPNRKQPGYAPDRLSELKVFKPDGAVVADTLDRAHGLEVDGVEIYQGIRSGLSMVLDVRGMGPRAIVLQERNRREAAAEVLDLGGRPVRFVVTTERDLHDVSGTGRTLIRLEHGTQELLLSPDAPFDFGGTQAKVTGLRRWGSFSYARSPGMPAVYLGFILVLAGCALLVFPAGVAVLETERGRTVARIQLPRGGELLAADWQATTAEPG